MRTEELLKRPSRAPDCEREVAALSALVSALAESPGTILQTLADKVLEVLQGDSAGLSLLTMDGARFYWAAIAGAWQPHVGGGTPRDFGPCGDVLDRNVPMLFTHWERRYPYLGEALPLAEEGLLVPFYVNGKSVGTIWAIAHNDHRKFDAEDLRLLKSLGQFASAAYQAVQSIESLKLEIVAREQAEMGFRELTSTLATQIAGRTAELRLSDAFLSDAQRLTRTGSFSWRVSSDEIRWSDELYRIFALDPRDPLTMAVLRVRIHPEDAGSLADLVRQARAAPRDFSHELRLRMPDGWIKYVQLIAHGARNEKGALEYIGTVQDVTERRAQQEALARTRAELAHAARLATVAELSAAIAHQVNQPLAAVAADAAACHRWLSASTPNLERARLSAERIVRDANSACEVVNRVRALFRQSEPSTAALDLNEVIEEVRQLVLGEVGSSDLSIEADLQADLPRILADRVQIQQVIVNLVRNGIEAMDGTTDGPKVLLIRSRSEGTDQARVDVCDQGGGVLDAENVFKPFFTTKKTGMGMGLAICRSIIEAHEGRLSVTRNDGPGATFSFQLPVATPDAPCADQALGIPPGIAAS